MVAAPQVGNRLSRDVAHALVRAASALLPTLVNAFDRAKLILRETHQILLPAPLKKFK
jgi:hypothetical protein